MTKHVARLSFLCLCPEALPPFTQAAAERDFWAFCAYTTRLAFVRTSLPRKSAWLIPVSIPVTEGL